MNFNKVILGGNLTRDPEARPNNGPVTFGMAINRRYRDRDNNQREEVVFVDVEAWGRTGENIERFFSKGNRILIEGRLKLNEWEDRETGAKRSKISIVAEQFQFVDRKSDEGRPAQSQPAGGGGYNDDDIPF